MRSIHQVVKSFPCVMLALGLMLGGCEEEKDSRVPYGQSAVSGTVADAEAQPSLDCDGADQAGSVDSGGGTVEGEVVCTEIDAALVDFDDVVESPMPAAGIAGSSARSATQSWRAALVREMNYALAPLRRDGTSTCALYSNGGTWTVTDFDYINDQSSLFPKEAKRYLAGIYGGNAGTYGGPGPTCKGGPSTRKTYLAGYCKIAIDTLIVRTLGMHQDSRRVWVPNYRLPNYAQMNLEAISGDLAPGDVLVDLNAPHIMMVYAILARDGSGKPTSIDVVDSNYVATYVLGRHKMSGAELSRYRRLTNLLAVP